ncbi:lipid asymmetry maintenance protein MlaB [Chromobacterium sp. IIBBL 290-4]|uniref:STAS domain-containing protein n=1 Tax=Chromobacterium sp. IIBBL 290-4 TaxID=2953890 RepID=UPI0020B78FE6|nr:STAS domain-containing protein [Chromobacterium sp. IIBBL 290-4]UTH75045.1 STAS domain-containing protein [Chromobacterium sp. IIBBL 290-4]
MTTSIQAGNEETIYQAAEFRQRLAEALQGGQDIELDLSMVEEIDCAGMQVLLWLQREASLRGLALRLIAPSAAVRSFARIMGFSALRLPPPEESGHGS